MLKFKTLLQSMKDDEKKIKMVKRYQVNLAGIVKEEGTHEDRVSKLQPDHRRNGKRFWFVLY